MCDRRDGCAKGRGREMDVEREGGRRTQALDTNKHHTELRQVGSNNFSIEYTHWVIYCTSGRKGTSPHLPALYVIIL